MGKEREEKKGEVKATREQRESIWRAIFKLDEVGEKVEYKERISFWGRVLGRLFDKADDVMRDTIRDEISVSLANGSIIPLGISYYKGVAKMIEVDLLELTSLENLPSLTNVCCLVVQAAKTEQKEGYPSYVFYEVDGESGEILPPVGGDYRGERRKSMAYSLTFAQAEEMLSLLGSSKA